MRSAVVEGVLIAVAKPLAVCVVEAVIDRRVMELMMPIRVWGQAVVHVIVRGVLAIVPAALARIAIRVRSTIVL